MCSHRRILAQSKSTLNKLCVALALFFARRKLKGWAVAIMIVSKEDITPSLSNVVDDTQMNASRNQYKSGSFHGRIEYKKLELSYSYNMQTKLQGQRVEAHDLRREKDLFFSTLFLLVLACLLFAFLSFCWIWT